ncbi:YwdI family protein [Sporosarcina sp. G11-34]|uniref:YwdI family protein n=1 Tax=Sporosarcina sp. G11-34 TaxID=2849605 RepID=UPI0022A9B383|nr:YwdI family protein [Sporosarcina sp. G11-34]MCZ2257478.1 YwdI family protein [Sporosarcina sp. G11-34]
MIPYNRIILEMERQLSVARSATDERKMREALSAVRSLCEVALSGEEKREENTFPEMLHTNPVVQSFTSLDAKPLEEKDANGGSIFDF